MGIPWSDDEIRILREAYPHGGVSGTVDELAIAGYKRSQGSVSGASIRYGVRVLPEARARHLMERPQRQRDSASAVDLSPDRPLTVDSVEIAHWFAERGFPPHGIAEEINRPVEAIRKALRMQPPAIDTDPYWPRRDDMILGRAIA